MRLLRLVPSAVMVILGLQTASAQLVPLQGKVTLKQANGTVVPVSGAQVDVYRTDIKATLHATTDATGAWQLAGVPMIGTYTIVVSAKGAKPTFMAGVRASRSPDNDFTLTPGDGSRPTLEQIAAFQEATRDVESQNREITRVNDAVQKSFQAGNEAYNAGRMDAAIEKYREALAALPDEPTVLTNLSVALHRRGSERWNESLKTKGDREPAKKDWIEAADVSRRAFDLLAKAADSSAAGKERRLSAASAYARAMGLVAIKVQASLEQSDTAWRAYRQWIALEKDQAKKASLLNEALEMVWEAGNTDLAIAESRKILAANPNHMLAHYVLGVALFATDDKKHFQESADQLQWYVDHAPADDPKKASVRDALQFIIGEGIRPKRRP